MTFWKRQLHLLTLIGATISADEILSSADEIPAPVDETSSRQLDGTSFHQSEEKCQGPRPLWASMRYTTPEGIGYKSGYTTVEGFFAFKTSLKDAWVPFLDLRGHVFDNGKLAANAGLGLRYIARSRVYGMNAYYDYRNTKQQHYNQVAAGLESLGRIWDFRINGYLPLGRKQSPFSHPKFVAFKGHSLLVKRDRHFAMKGANAEVGIHINHFENAPLYFAGGPYYLTGIGDTTYGGELRGFVDLFSRYLRLEGNVSYDHFFKWIGQGQISINIPFGKKWKIKKKAGQSCSKMATLYTRAIQPPDRFEIIPVGKQKSTSRAINPVTKQPWVFWFVDNTSSSAGTFEDPFPSLLDAQNASSPNQGIYVFPGDGTTRGMANGIILQNGQIFLGAGIQQFVQTAQGNVIVPPQASSSPNITNIAGNVVTLANNNHVAGFNVLLQNGHGFAGNGILNFFANQNSFVTNTPNFDGVNLINPSGRVFVGESSFSGFSDTNGGNHGNGIYLELDAGSTLNNIYVTRSQFSNISDPSNGNGGNGIYFNGNGGVLSNAEVSNCNFSNISSEAAGIGIITNGGTINNLNILNCNFSNISNEAEGIGISTNGGAINDLNILSCNFSNISGEAAGIYTLGNDGNINNINIGNCSFNDLDSGWGVYSQASGGIIGNLSIFNCSFNNASGVVSTVENEIYGGSIDNFNLVNCTFENNNVDSSGVFFTQLWANGTINHLNVSNNYFNNPNYQIFYLFCQPTFSNIISAQLLDNTFIGSSNSFVGYAATLYPASGTLCLKFIGNTAMPANNPIPYLFVGVPPGVFNRTTGSDSSTNTGQIFIDDMVGAPGSCSE
jgi:hypothetical protein